MKRAVLYLRVSKHEQTIENQRIELERVAIAKGWKVIATFKDEGVSGAFGREVRAQYDLMLKQGVQAKFDVVLAWDVSRLSRSLVDLVTTLDELHACGIDLYLHQQAIDTTTPAGKLSFGIFAALAEFESELIRERTMAGLAAARARGRNGGRKFSLTKSQVRLAQAAMANRDTSVSELCEELGIQPVTLYRYVDPHGNLREYGQKVLAL